METKFRVPIIDDAVDEAFENALAQGIVEGLAIGLLLVLDERFTVPAAHRAKIIECTNADRLRECIRRAVTANTLDEVFRG